ncbi:hypothetical protein NMY22_g9578 [Coprinellus aureogranulatus]|nr:hypothetical protein NMY22_g9578 [Coprinellus aureogranulatus]
MATTCKFASQSTYQRNDPHTHTPNLYGQQFFRSTRCGRIHRWVAQSARGQSRAHHAALHGINFPALLYYDYFLTFTREVEWFWLASYKFSWASLFFFANRYMSVLGHIPYIYEFFSFRNDPGRLKLYGPEDVSRKPLFRHPDLRWLSVKVFLIARTYALWNRSKCILWLLLGVSVPAIIYTIAVFCITNHEFHEFTPEDLNPFTCLVVFSPKRSYIMLTSWICVFIFDLVVFCLSVYKVIQIASSKERPPILHLLLRDGIVYFGLVSLGCLVSVLTYWPTVFDKDAYSRGCAEVLANSLSSALASRLFLNLRDPTLSHRSQHNCDHFATGTRFDFVSPHHPEDNGNSCGRGHDRTMTVQLRTLEELPEPEESPSTEVGTSYGHGKMYAGPSQA